MARNAIVAPPAQPPRYGLIAAAPVVEDAEWRWGEGFTFDPEACAPGGREAIDCGSFADALDPVRGPANVDGDPFVVWAGDECSTFGYGARDWQGRARRALAAIESFELANELWTGDLRDAETLSNVALTDLTSDRLTAAAVSPQDALGMIEQALGVCGKGRRGMVHVSPQVLTELVGGGGGPVTQQGGVYLTPMGHLVVADAGYDGSGPGGAAAGSTQFIYGTSMVSLRLGPVEVVGGPNSMGVDVSNNRMTTLAFRPVAYVWDECCHVAAEVDVAVPAIGGAS